MTLRLGIGVVLPDILNVKDFGARGDGLTTPTDDSAAIQAAIDSAFGTAGSPHGTNATLNKALYFPQGNYVVNTPLVFTQVRGGRVFGAGQLATTITGGIGCVVTNGMEYCSFENIQFSAGGSATVPAFELDWNNVGSVGLKGNVFTNCSFGSNGRAGAPYGFRIALGGNGGAGNQFYACNFGFCGIGFVTWGSGATGQYIQGGGISTTNTAIWVKAGQVASIHDIGFAGNTTQDVLMDTDGPLLAKGNRTESPLSFVFNSSTSVAVLDGHSAADSSTAFCKTKGKVILDSCTAPPTGVFCTDAAYIGKVYARGCVFQNAAFFTAFTGNGGTLAQNI